MNGCNLFYLALEGNLQLPRLWEPSQPRVANQRAFSDILLHDYYAGVCVEILSNVPNPPPLGKALWASYVSHINKTIHPAQTAGTELQERSLQRFKEQSFGLIRTCRRVLLAKRRTTI